MMKTLEKLQSERKFQEARPPAAPIAQSTRAMRTGLPPPAMRSQNLEDRTLPVDDTTIELFKKLKQAQNRVIK